MFIKQSKNKYGTSISLFICDFCGGDFSVVPGVPDDEVNYWTGCLAPECTSYDPKRDVELMVGLGKTKLHKTEIV